MKRTLKLTLNEIKHLKWTVLVTALALALFTASLFSVIFVYNDLSVNVFNYVDTTDHDKNCLARRVSVKQASDNIQDGLYCGDIQGLTYAGVTIVADNGNKFVTQFEVKEVINGVTITHLNFYRGYAFYVNDNYLSFYSDLMQNVAIPQNAWEILLDGFIAEQLQVGVGDKVQINDYNFTVCGTYNREIDGFDKIHYPFVMSVDENTLFDVLNSEFDSSYTAYLQYLRLQRLGVDVEYGYSLKFYMDNLSLVNGFLIAIALTLFAVNLLILYAMFSVILRNRRSYVCRLKIMGASNALVFAVYFVIIAVLLAVICVAAFFLSKLMVSNIMEACSQAFESAFAVSTSFGVVGVYFASVLVLLGALCFLSVRKIDNKAIVFVTRSD